jgi:SAM-dependent methyltransferase
MQSVASNESASVRLLLRIFQSFPAKNLIFKAPEGRPELEYEQECDFPYYNWFGMGPEMFAGKDVLDLGCGFGGRTVKFREYGATSVTGLEISNTLVETARAYADRRGLAEQVRFLVGYGERIPAEEDSFDQIVMFDVMEHVVSPRAVLRECMRVLRPGGTLATVFPPYYHPRAGSHLSGYATSLPGLNLLFPSQSLRRAAKISLDERGMDYRPFVREIPSDKLWNINGLTVRRFKALVDEMGWQTRTVRYISDFDHRVSGHASRLMRLRKLPWAWFFEAPAQVPLLQELLCLRVCALLSK